MALLSIVIAPDRRLKTVCKPVETVDDGLRATLRDMLETMYRAPGIGLAAPQVGLDRRAIVVDITRKGESRRPMCLVNPSIVWKSDDVATMDEGCLSLPDVFVDVDRPERVRIDYLDQHGEPRQVEADGLLSRCLQHEIDHLDGVLHVDYLSRIKRELLLRKLAKKKGTLLAERAKRFAE